MMKHKNQKSHLDDGALFPFSFQRIAPCLFRFIDKFQFNHGEHQRRMPPDPSGRRKSSMVVVAMNCAVHAACQ